jgi:Ni,Fe-hydrogenase III small subunit
LLITGPVSKNRELALKKTYDATPAPKIVIAVGAYATSGEPFIDHPEQLNGAASDLFISVVRLTLSPFSTGFSASSTSCPPSGWASIHDGRV